MRTFRMGSAMGWLLAFGLVLAPTARSQTTTGKILGTVTDASGAPIGDATVRADSQDTGLVSTHVTSTLGTYTLQALRPGTYTLRFEAAGFEAGLVRDVVVHVDQTVRVDMQMRTGALTETVEVTAAAPLVSSHTSELGEVIEKEQIQALPLNGRLFSQLVTLTPGTVPDGFFDEPENPAGAGARTATSASVNGLPWSGTTYTLDGIYNMEPLSAYITVSPPIEAIEEFKVQTNNPSAEYGAFGGAIVNVTMRSGTNELHGSAFEYFRDDALNSRRFVFPGTTPYEPPLRANQFGAALGGPVLRNKLFFFADYQGLRLRQGRQYRITVPTLAMRNGDFSGLVDPETGASLPVIDPLTGLPFPGNIIPRARFDPVAARAANVWPVPNRPGDTLNYEEFNSQTNDSNAFDVKLDYDLSGDRLFVRWSRSQRTLRSPSPGNRFINSNDDSVNSDGTNQNAVLGYTRAFGPSVLNELRLGFNSFDVLHFGNDFGVDKNNELGIPNGNLPAFVQTSGIAAFYIGDIQPTGSPDWTNAERLARSYQLSDTLTWLRGRHSMRLGFDVLRLTATLTNPEISPRGAFDFDGRYTGVPFADFLLGYPDFVGRGIFASRPRVSMWNAGLFVQDDLRVNSKLTLNVGLRWDVFTPPVEADNRQSNFNLQDGLFHVAEDGNRGPDVATFKRGFAPRLGFAYTPDSGRTAVRGAFGVSYFRDNFGASGGTLEKNYPFVQSFERVDTSGAPFASLSLDGLPGFVSQPVQSRIAPPAGLSVFVIPRDFQPNQALMWNLGVQRQLTRNAVVELTYVGTRGSHLFRTRNINVPSTPGPGNIDLRRPYHALVPDIQTILLRASDGHSKYHGLQFKYTQRLARGLRGLVSYTWSRAQDDLTIFWPYDDKLNWGVSTAKGTDLPHNLVASFTWDLPLAGDRQGLAQALFGGWSLSGIATVRSGPPLTITVTQDPLNTGTRNRANVTCTNVGMPREIGQWFDTSCFARPADYAFGNAPKDVVRGPGVTNIDASLSKRTRLGRGTSLELRADVFNVLNTAHFGLPVTRLGSSLFGQITDTVLTPREFQLGLKLAF